MNRGLEDLLSNQSFHKYILNPNQGDNEFWKNWIKLNERNQELYNEARRLILDFYEPLTAEEFEEEAICFQRKINVTSTEKNDIIGLYETRRPKRNPWLRYAAIFFVVITSLFIITQLIIKNNKATIVADSYDDVFNKGALKGQKLTIVFPDGTVVKLNSESYISYPKQFNDKIREVYLHGEAYFDVAHYDNWPFVVHSGDIETKVLGTAFNISAYPENNYINIALVNGSVEVKSNNLKPVQLKPMQMISINESKGEPEISKFDFKEVTGWKDNIIVFKNASFKEVQFTLERWYDVDFIFDQSPVFEGGYCGEFSDQSLENVLKGMSSNKFNFIIDGEKVFIN